MTSGDFKTARFEGKECMDCGKKIKVGEQYWSYTRRELKYCYCKKCKEKPEHTRKLHNYDEIYERIFAMPLFKHEMEDKFRITPNHVNSLVKNMYINGYPVRAFRWNAGTRSGKQKLNWQKHYKRGCIPTRFILYYIEGLENVAIARIVDYFEYEDVDWKDLMTALFGRRIPESFKDKEAIKQWANQNVFN